jgi:hypothetical protein
MPMAMVYVVWTTTAFLYRNLPLEVIGTVKQALREKATP